MAVRRPIGLAAAVLFLPMSPSCGGDGLVAQTDIEGNYRLYGVKPSTTLRVTRTGYQSATVPVPFMTHGTLAVRLVADRPAMAVSGLFTLIIDAGGQCPALPAAARHREYSVTVVQTGNTVRVEPDFRRGFSGDGLAAFSGTIDAGGASFDLGGLSISDFFGYQSFSSPPPITEPVPGAGYFTVTGAVFAASTPSGVAGSFAGEITLYDPDRFPQILSPLASCRSDSLRFELRAE